LALPAAFWYLAALLWFALGLLSKPMLVTLPCVMLLLDYWPLRRLECRDGRLRLRPRLVLEKLPFFVLAGISSIIQVHVAQQAGALSTLGNSPLGARVGNALVSYLHYLGKSFWPVDLAFPYPYPGRWPPGEVILAGALLGGITVFSLCQARRRPWLVVGWFWFLGMLVPVLGLVQWGTEAMADRFTYVPLVGLFLVLAMGAAELPRRLVPRTVLASAAVLLVLACVLRTRNQLQYWRNGEMLARHAIAVTKDNYVAYNVLGGCLYRAGRLDEAIASFRTAIEIKPRSASAENNLGLALAHQGKLQEALRHYRLALEYSPAYPQAMINLGDALAREGKLDEAIHQYREALRRDPDLAPALNNLALVLLRKKNYAEAIIYYRQALAIAPHNAAAYKNLGLALAAQGDVQQAIGCLETALRLNPDLPDAAQQLEALTARAKMGAPHP
jgi:Tfp pilus assembly protein PilF